MQQQTITINTPVHVKAALNGEFRRFLLTDLTYANLDTTVKSLFNLTNLVVCLKFQDDEKDWVLLTTDAELLYAVELAGSPLRLSVQITAATPVAKPKGCFPKDKCWKKKGKGHCRGGNKAERLEACQARITARIAFLEERANSQQLTSEREIAVRSKISRLQEKLEFITSRQNLGEVTPVCTTEEQPTPKERWAGRREKWQKLRERLPTEVMENFHQTKSAFRAAKESGNPEEIEACKAAFFAAKKAKWEAVAALRKEAGEECWVPKCRKLNALLPPEILENFRQTKVALRAAKESGNRDEIVACRAAMKSARKAKWLAKAALKNIPAGEEQETK